MRDFGNGAIVLGNAINRDHPLNRGLAAWWMDISGLSYPRMPLLNTAKIVQGTPLTHTAIARGELYRGFRTAKLDGSTSWMTGTEGLGVFSFVQNTMEFSVSFTMKLANTTQRAGIMDNIAGSSANKGFVVIYENGAGKGTKACRFFATLGPPGFFVGDWASPDNWITDTNWHTVTLVGTGTSVNFFLDGVQGTTTTLAAFGSLSSGNSTYNVRVGALQTAGALPFAGNIRDVLIHNRRINAATLSREARTGYPTMLNRLSPLRTFYFGTAAAPPATVRDMSQLHLGSVSFSHRNILQRGSIGVNS